MLFFTFREKSVTYVFVNFPFDVQKLSSPLYWANRIGIQAMLLETAKFRTLQCIGLKQWMHSIQCPIKDYNVQVEHLPLRDFPRKDHEDPPPQFEGGGFVTF